MNGKQTSYSHVCVNAMCACDSRTNLPTVQLRKANANFSVPCLQHSQDPEGFVDTLKDILGMCEPHCPCMLVL